jgi:hypothetical protein
MNGSFRLLSKSLVTELLQMQMWNDLELLAIAKSKISLAQQQRHIELLEKNQIGEITPAQRQELNQLRISADQLMLRKAYAWSVLRWRGHKIAALDQLPEL